jgi:hypothetical protein
VIRPVPTTIPPIPPTAWIEVTLAHHPLAVFYEVFTPTLTINGHKERKPWGTYVISVIPGDYEVAASYPWIVSECGRNSVRFSLAAGERKKVTYCARFIRFIPGAMKVEAGGGAEVPPLLPPKSEEYEY